MEVDEHKVNGTLNETLNSSLQTYNNIAEALKDDESVNALEHVLLEITSGSTSDVPFLFLEGSSGSGKSQMAFNLKEKLRRSRQCCYFLFERVRETSQDIYRNFANVSDLFLKCLEKDIESLDKDHVQSPSCSALYERNLFVYGFLYALLIEESGTVSITRKCGKDVADLIVSKGMENCRPIVILDECIAITYTTNFRVRFVRNCVRSLGLGLVMLGTDSRAVGVQDNIGAASRSGEPRRWCYICGEYPKVNLNILNLPRNVPVWFPWILEHSRPLFAQIATQEYKKLEDNFHLDTLLSNVFVRVKSVKKIFSDYYGQLGQIRLFQNAHCQLKDFSDRSTALIHSHFAQLNGNEKSFYLNNDGMVENSGLWNPSSIFPSINDDVLLYLILMGGKEYSAFELDGKSVPYSYFFLKINSNSDHRAHILDFSNAAQKSNDGMFLEALLCTTVCLASHSNGISGVGLHQFLLNVVYHVQPRKINLSDIVIEGLDRLSHSVIPFLSPPNQEWPTFVTHIPETNFGYLRRTTNFERVDLSASNNIYGESKDYGSVILLETMRKIINRIPGDAKLELVFVRKLQSSYFNYPAEPFNQEFKGTTALNKGYFKIDASKHITRIESIPGLPSNSSANGIVIFFEIDKNVKLIPQRVQH